MVSFLKEHKLGIYLDTLKSNDIKNMAQLSKVEVKNLDMKPGHQIKLRKRISDWVKLKSHKSQIKIGTEGRRLSSIIQQKKEQEAGVYKEVRNGVRMDQEQGPRLKEIKTVLNTKRPGAQAQFAKKRRAKFVTTQTATMSTDCQTEPVKQKQSCWFCYKIILNETDQNTSETPKKEICHPLMPNKLFCSKTCLRKEFGSISSSCMQCKRIVFKTDGILKQNKWFCSVNCVQIGSEKFLENLDSGSEEDDLDSLEHEPDLLVDSLELPYDQNTNFGDSEDDEFGDIEIDLDMDIGDIE